MTIKAVYRSVVDHLTKALGAVGLGISLIDPTYIWGAASTYLGENPQRKIGAALFVLVIARGWYTGWKAKQNANPPA